MDEDQRKNKQNVCCSFQQICFSVLLVGLMVQFFNIGELSDVEQPYLHGGIVGKDQVKNSQNKLNKQIELSLSQYKSMKQDFGLKSLQDSFEANSQATLTYRWKNSVNIKTNAGFTYSKQDVSAFFAQAKSQAQHEKMFYGSVGFEKTFLRGMALNAQVGLVRAKDYRSGLKTLYPTAGLTLTKDFENAKLSFMLSNQALGGGSYTGIYGNQIFRHAKLNLHTSLSKKWSLDGNMAFGQSHDAFEGDQRAMIFVSGMELNYQLHENVSMGMGTFYRHQRINSDFISPVNNKMLFTAMMKASFF